MRKLSPIAAMTLAAAILPGAAAAAPAPGFSLDLRGDCSAGLVASMTWSNQPGARSFELHVVMDGTTRDTGSVGPAKRSGQATDAPRVAVDVSHTFEARGILFDRKGNVLVDRTAGSITGDCALAR